MSSTPRERAREQTMADIVAIGRKQLATEGAAALSLRAVARDLGVVSSAVYRYVRNRDELLTLLLVDAYTELANAVDEAVNGVDSADYAARFRALGRAVRSWALGEPARYGLLFGSPVPGYHAPSEQTTTPGTRVIAILTRIFTQAYRAGALRKIEPPKSQHMSGQLAADVRGAREEMSFDVPDHLVTRGVLVWAALFGAVNFEVFGQYGTDTFSAPDELFEHQLTALAGLIGLE